jgi:anaerobic ribonucleoside-triphosphate reductase activating protein
MGGEPLAWENRETIRALMMDVKHELPDTLIYIWTGYTYEELSEEIVNGAWPEPDLKWILNHADVLIDGPYIQEQKDVTLLMRGSKNQRILKNEGGKYIDITP